MRKITVKAIKDTRTVKYRISMHYPGDNYTPFEY